MKKNAAILLMISSIFWIVVNIRFGILSVSNNWEYYKEHLVDFSIDRFFIIIPVSLLILAISLLQHNGSKITNADEIEVFQKDNSIISVGDWLVNFIISIIPLIGLIFIIIWANDNNNKTRKNWAIASLIWSSIILILTIVIYSVFFAAIMKSIN